MYYLKKHIKFPRFFFVCSQWMAVEEGDGQIERVIPVAGKDDMTQFGQLFSHSIRKKFSNDHLWFSVFSRPTRSSFTRVQRVSCCFSLLFMTMIVNCMFFKSTNPDHTTSVHIGPITITLQQLYISVVSSLIILPPSVAIITIFKKSRPKQNTVQLNNAAKSVRFKILCSLAVTELNLLFSYFLKYKYKLIINFFPIINFEGNWMEID